MAHSFTIEDALASTMGVSIAVIFNGAPLSVLARTALHGAPPNRPTRTPRLSSYKTTAHCVHEICETFDTPEGPC